MPFVRIVDPFQPQTQRRCGPSYGRCSRQQQQSSRPASNPIMDFFSALEKEFAAPNEQPQTPKPQFKKIINPNFDVIETDASYIIQADLPGVQDKKSIDIEFTDAQTLVIKGEISRRQLFKPTAVVSTSEQQTSTEEQLPVYSETSNSTSSSSSDTASTHSHQPTVEETVDESDNGSDNEFEVVDSPSTLKAASASPAPVPAPTPEQNTDNEVPSVPQQQAESSNTQQQEQAPKEKFWLNERSTGVFSRTLKFEQLIDQDTVTASLEYGVLEIVVPKREKYVRRVQIQ